MEQSPKFFKLHRKTVGVLMASTKVLGNLAKVSVGSTFLQGLVQLGIGSKINLLVPLIISGISYAALNANDLILFLIGATDVQDPIREITNTLPVMGPGPKSSDDPKPS